MASVAVDMPTADPEDRIDVHPERQNPVRDPVVGHPVLLHGRHPPLVQGRIVVRLLAGQQLEDRVAQELQPFVRIDGSAVAGAVVGEGPAEDGQLIRGHAAIPERRLGQERTDLHLELSLHAVSEHGAV